MGYELDRNAIKVLKDMKRKLASLSISPFAPSTRMKTREIGVNKSNLIAVLVYHVDSSTSPDFTYTCKTLAGGNLSDGSSSTSTSKSPEITAAQRIPEVDYTAASSGSIGIGCYVGNAFHLLIVGEGIESEEECYAEPGGS
jgi:hypothetical protein